MPSTGPGLRPERKLRIKSIYPVYRLREDVFRIGAQIGVTKEFTDPKGQLWDLIRSMDGAHSVAEVVGEMRRRHPELSEDDVLAGIARLDSARLLEDSRPTSWDDAAGPGYRYNGNQNYFRHFTDLSSDSAAYQDRLAGSRVALLGLGGVGSNVLKLLIGLGVGEIVAVDYDRVELSNLNRQFFYREQDVGRLKTEAAARIVPEIHSGIRFTAIDRRIDSYRDLADVVAGADLVVSTIDEPLFLALRRVNKACVVARVPCVFGAMQITRGRIFSVQPFESGCFDCLHVHYHRTDPLFVEQFRGFHETPFDPPPIAFAPDIVTLCGRMVAEAARILTGHMEPQTFGAQYELDFEANRFYKLLSWPRYSDDCPTCGRGEESSWPAFSYYRGDL